MHMKEHNEVLPMFEYFADIVPEPIYWLDLDHQIIGANFSAFQAAGAQSKEDILGKTAFDFYPERIAKKLIKNQEEVIRTNKKLCFEETIVSNK